MKFLRCTVCLMVNCFFGHSKDRGCNSVALRVLYRDRCQLEETAVSQFKPSVRTVTFTVHTARVPSPHNHSHHNQRGTPNAAVHTLVLLMMGIMMPETC